MSESKPARGFDLDSALRTLDSVRAPRVAGRVSELVGLVVRATAPGARVGESVLIERPRAAPLRAEVVGFVGEEVVLLPLGSTEGIGPDSVVRPTGSSFSIPCGDALLGRTISALGEPIDHAGLLDNTKLVAWPVERGSPDPLKRRRVSAAISTGVRAIDGLLTLGEGQRVGLFSGPGLGKSSLLGLLARHSTADVIVVGLVGERGREVRDFVEKQLDGDIRRRTIVVVATADAPPLVRLKCALCATAVAEYFRDQGKRVLLLLDSLTRVARAQREVGLAAGEPPARQGYPPSVFALLPQLLERAGQGEYGSITAVYSVLTAADEGDDPIADEIRALLDGHITLSRDLAARNHWPAIDVLRSLSRVMDDLIDDEHRLAAARLRELCAIYERQRELVLLGAYRNGSDPATDQALALMPAIESYLRQSQQQRVTSTDARAGLIELFSNAKR